MFLKVLACDVLTREVSWCAARSPHTLDIAFTEKGEHNHPGQLMALLQQKIDAADIHTRPYDAILLVYGLCGNAVNGLRSGKYPLVIPRAHDCATLFLGSKEAFQTHFGANPSQRWTSVGYSERGDSILSDNESRIFSAEGYSYAEMVETYGEENARYLLEALTPKYENKEIPFLDVPETRVEEIVDKIREHITDAGQSMLTLPGSLSLVAKLLNGDWDEKNFLLVPPGHIIRGVYDQEEIIKAAPAASGAE